MFEGAGVTVDPLSDNKDHREENCERAVLRALARIKDNNDYNHKLNTQNAALQAENFRLQELNKKLDQQYSILSEETRRLQATVGSYRNSYGSL